MSKTSKPKGKIIFCKVSMEMFVEIEKIAKEEYWNLSDVVREAVKLYLRDREQKSKQGEEK